MTLQPVKIAINALKNNKGRAALTVLGIVIGITAVVVVLSAGLAIKGFILGEIEAFGSNYIEVEVKSPQTAHASVENAFSMMGGAVVTTLKEKDAEAIAKHPNIGKYYAGAMGQEVASFENEFKKTFLMGVNAAFIDIDKSEVEYGRFFSEEENLALAKVAVLGSKIKKDLFGDEDPVGKSITIGKEKFRVIGQLKERGATFGFNMDEMIFMPVKSLQKRLLGIDYVTFIFAQMIDNDLAERTAEDITFLMRSRHKIDDPIKDDFAVITMDQAMEMMGIVIYGIQVLLIALGSISLIVGGVGIMNIMYVSVTERTFEIGLRKAVGAKYKNILWQFLYEAVIVTFSGGIIGIIVGILFTFIISQVASSLGFDWSFSISWTGIILAISMSAIVGLVFGIYPARKAAKKNPIEALRF